MEFNAEKLKAMARPRTALEKASRDFRMENADWLPLSIAIAVRISQILQIKGLTQAQLATMLGVSQFQVSKLLSGKENFELKTIAKLQSILGEQIIDVCIAEKANVNLNSKIKIQNTALPLL